MGAHPCCICCGCSSVRSVRATASLVLARQPSLSGAPASFSRRSFSCLHIALGLSLSLPRFDPCRPSRLVSPRFLSRSLCRLVCAFPRRLSCARSLRSSESSLFASIHSFVRASFVLTLASSVSFLVRSVRIGWVPAPSRLRVWARLRVGRPRGAWGGRSSIACALWVHT